MFTNVPQLAYPSGVSAPDSPKWTHGLPQLPPKKRSLLRYIHGLASSVRLPPDTFGENNWQVKRFFRDNINIINQNHVTHVFVNLVENHLPSGKLTYIAIENDHRNSAFTSIITH